ncbi:MAG: hypothetical protein R3342_08395 [Lutibacter sp.]|uniref:hypothetical protein n=1 Tax=Lutibacter sp. TaxID=1925666 RepID=UPI00299DA262|nr:hypothetical protein [Lutibacter sp.]MDX1829549.1 hypothetical protein [Lutibacter sp.]
MQKITCLLFTLFMCKCPLKAQTAEPSKAVDKRTLQIELESIYSIEKENISESKSLSTPNFLFRYGVLKNVELQLSIPIIKEDYYEHNELVYSTHKFDDTQLGFSINLWNEKKWLPEAALMTRAYLHYQSNLKFDYVGQTVSLNLSNTLTKKLALNYNFGYAFEKNTELSWFLITNLTYNLSSNWSVFIEYTGNNTTNNNYLQNGITGISHQINDSFSFDFGFSKGLNHSQFFTGGRLTWVIKT